MADKLRGAEKMIPDLQGVWNAHKLRNRLAHEPGLVPSHHEVKHAAAAFERVLRKFT
jgi:hypothetical protein